MDFSNYLLGMTSAMTFLSKANEVLHGPSKVWSSFLDRGQYQQVNNVEHTKVC